MKDREKLKDEIIEIIAKNLCNVQTSAGQIMQLIDQTQPDYRDEIGPIQVNMMHEEYRQWANWKKGIGSIVQESNEVVEKDWEIVEYKEARTDAVPSDIWKKINEIEWHVNQEKGGSIITKSMMEKLVTDGKVVINAVRIKSTGEVYRIGDKVIWDALFKIRPYLVIDKIELNIKSDIRIWTQNHCFSLKEMNYYKFRHYQESMEQVEEEYKVTGNESWEIKELEWDNQKQIIKSVRVKGTGEIFSIGDTIIQRGATGNCKIKSFTVDTINGNKHLGGMAVEIEPSGNFAISDIEHTQPTEQEMEPHIQWCMMFNKQSREEAKKQVKGKWSQIQQWAKESNESFRKCIGDITTDSTKSKTEKEQPLLTTEDGVDIYNEEVTVFRVYTDTWYTEVTTVSAIMIPGRVKCDEWKVFSTEAARDKYIKEQKPMFSLKEIEKAMCASEDFGWDNVKPAMMKLAEQKLNSKQ